jgi:hypothetical protein
VETWPFAIHVFYLIHLFHEDGRCRTRPPQIRDAGAAVKIQNRVGTAPNRTAS